MDNISLFKDINRIVAAYRSFANVTMEQNIVILENKKLTENLKLVNTDLEWYIHPECGDWWLLARTRDTSRSIHFQMVDLCSCFQDCKHNSQCASAHFHRLAGP